MQLSRVFYLVLGCISLVLGVIGVILPVLPTTPFLLLTSFCFAKGSKRFHDWFTSTSLYKNHLESFATDRSMTLKTKICILVPASIMLLFPLVILKPLPLKLFILFLYCYKYYYFIFKIKTITEETSIHD